MKSHNVCLKLEIRKIILELFYFTVVFEGQDKFEFRC